MTFNRFGKNKFKNKWTEQDGIKFASEGELARWNFLRMMEAEGKIKDLRRQIRFKLEVNDILICTYIADHGYVVVGADLIQEFYREELPNGRMRAGVRWREHETIEDFKGMETPEFKLKKKMMLAIHKIDIKIVKKPTASYK